MKKSFNIILIIVFCLFSSYLDSFSAEKLKVNNKEYTGQVIDMGICYTLDSMTTTFVIENNFQSQITISDLDPDYFLGSTNPNDFTRFLIFDGRNKPPYTLLPKEKQEYKLNFNNINNQFYNQIKGLEGLFKVKLQFAANQDTSTKVDFLIIARISKSYIGMYDTLNFDSVMVDSPNPIKLDLNFKNVWSSDIKVFADTIQLKTSKLTADEFQIDKKNRVLPFVLKSKEIISPFQINYEPKDIGVDTAIYKMYYYKNILQNPNDLSVDSSLITFNGIGVEQNIEIEHIDNNISYTKLKNNNYNINVGVLQVGEKKTIKVALKNLSNFNFGKESTTFSSNGNLICQIKRDLNKTLAISAIDSLEFEITAMSFGNFSQSVIISSDAYKRGFKGASTANTDVIFNIIGNAIEPKIFISTNELNFGDYIKSDSCPSSLTKSVIIKNIGNSDLIIRSLFLTPQDNSFNPTLPKLLLTAGEDEELKVTFTPNALGSHTSTLYIITNAFAPNDTIKINLLGNGIDEPIAKIMIDSINGMPGNDVVYSFKLDKSIVQLANSFKDELAFDKSLLQFAELITDNTALEGLSPSSIIETNDVGLKLDLNRINKQNFLVNETLFKVRFKTYLGNKLSTTLLFSNPKFGNSNCESIFLPTSSKGYFVIDSVCGLEYKTKQLSLIQFKITDLNYNTLSEQINISLEVPFSAKANISIFNANGNINEINEINVLVNNKNEFVLPFQNKSNGVYFVKFECGIYCEVKPLLIYK